VGTFPWDPDALGTMGGIIVDDTYFGAGEKTLTHELGHNLGLWHTHHGVSEVDPCSACWELANHTNGDVSGDFCSDTDPTPVNYDCSDPGGTDQCSGVVWGPTDPQNYMGYAPDLCYSEFTSQQWGRIHCWIGSDLLSLLAIGFTAVPVAGEGPLTAGFSYDSPIPTSSWTWYFGDGDSAMVQNPSHTYAPGLYDVSLLVETDLGELSADKPDYITAWADTLGAPDTSVMADVQGYWEIDGANAVPVEELILPLTLTNVTSVLFFDSVSFIGTRLDYFETKQVVFDNRFAGQLAYRLIADNGGGSPPLPPGTGPMARVHFRSRSSAVAGDTSYLSVGALGSYTLKATTLTTDFVPVFNGATLKIASACDCSAQGDINGDGEPTAVDLGILIDHVFAGGAKPPVDPLCPHADRGDMDCSGFDDALDIGIMIDWLYAGGAGPCDPCTCDPYPSNCP
jgi:PKD repeat protein